MSDALERGRDAYARQAWSEAFDQLSAADDDSALDPDDLERLGLAAALVGKDDVTIAVGVRTCLEDVAQERPHVERRPTGP